MKKTDYRRFSRLFPITRGMDNGIRHGWNAGMAVRPGMALTHGMQPPSKRFPA